VTAEFCSPEEVRGYLVDESRVVGIKYDLSGANRSVVCCGGTSCAENVEKILQKNPVGVIIIAGGGIDKIKLGCYTKQFVLCFPFLFVLTTFGFPS
jgi:hypothetical protein